MAALRLRLPQEPATQLIDLLAATDGDLQAIFDLAQGQLAAVRLHLRYGVAHHADQAPHPLADVERQVLRQAHELVRQHVRGCDLTALVGPLDIAVLLLRAGPAEARAQAGRLSAHVAEQRFELDGYEVYWRARASLAVHQPGPTSAPIKQVFEELFRPAN